MPRQVMSPIDLRSQAERQGITKTQQTVQAIASIIQTMGTSEQVRRNRQTLDRVTMAMAGGATIPEAIMAVSQKPEFSTGIPGALQRFGGMFQPSPGGMGQDIQRAIIGQAIQTDPLEREYKRAQIGAAEALTKQREDELKFAEPDRMLRQASLQLRIADGAMREYYWAEEGPYRDRLLKQAIAARESAIKIAEKYGTTSEAGNIFEEELKNIDEQIKEAGGKVKPKKVQASYMRPTKEQFDRTLRSLTSEEDKDRYYKRYYRPEFSR